MTSDFRYDNLIISTHEDRPRTIVLGLEDKSFYELKERADELLIPSYRRDEYLPTHIADKPCFFDEDREVYKAAWRRQSSDLWGNSTDNVIVMMRELPSMFIPAQYRRQPTSERVKRQRLGLEFIAFHSSWPEEDRESSSPILQARSQRERDTFRHYILERKFSAKKDEHKKEREVFDHQMRLFEAMKPKS